MTARSFALLCVIELLKTVAFTIAIFTFIFAWASL